VYIGDGAEDGHHLAKSFAAGAGLLLVDEGEQDAGKVDVVGGDVGRRQRARPQLAEEAAYGPVLDFGQAGLWGQQRLLIFARRASTAPDMCAN
jgi:hypothetical protein